MSRRTLHLQPHLTEVERTRDCLSEVASEAAFSPERATDILAAALEAARAAIERAEGQGEVTLNIAVSDSFLEVQILGPGEFDQPLPGQPRLRGLELPLMAALTDELTIRSRDHSSSVILGFKRRNSESEH